MVLEENNIDGSDGRRLKTNKGGTKKDYRRKIWNYEKLGEMVSLGITQREREREIKEIKF